MDETNVEWMISFQSVEECLVTDWRVNFVLKFNPARGHGIDREHLVVLIGLGTTFIKLSFALEKVKSRVLYSKGQRFILLIVRTMCTPDKSFLVIEPNNLTSTSLSFCYTLVPS